MISRVSSVLCDIRVLAVCWQIGPGLVTLTCIKCSVGGCGQR